MPWRESSFFQVYLNNKKKDGMGDSYYEIAEFKNGKEFILNQIFVSMLLKAFQINLLKALFLPHQYRWALLSRIFMDREANSCYHDIPGRLANAIYLVLLGSSLSLSRLQLAVLTCLSFDVSTVFATVNSWISHTSAFLGRVDCVCFLMFR